MSEHEVIIDTRWTNGTYKYYWTANYNWKSYGRGPFANEELALIDAEGFLTGIEAEAKARDYEPTTYKVTI